MVATYIQATAPDLPKAGLQRSKPQLVFLGIMAAILTALAVYVESILGMRFVQLLLLGTLLGFALFRGTFGFTGPWRNFVVHRRGHGVRVTLVMLAVASIGIMPLVNGGGYGGAFATVGWSLLFGSFLFGLGMQLGGCCGSGTAYVAGGGSARVMVTLAFFIVGSVLGSVHAPFWWGVPNFGELGSIRFAESLGVPGGILLTLAVLGGLALLTVFMERKRHGKLVLPEASPDTPWYRRAFLGPWTPLTGGIVLGLGAYVVVLVSSHTWGITFGYTLWGAKMATAMGFDLAQWTAPGTDSAFWAAGWAQGALSQSVFQNDASIMNFGLIIGAAIGAGLVGKWHPSFKGIPMMSLVAAAIGGLMMGYGARISAGCNIGAMVNGIASGSLHGWIWMFTAFAGTIVGIYLRPLFKMSN